MAPSKAGGYPEKSAMTCRGAECRFSSANHSPFAGLGLCGGDSSIVQLVSAAYLRAVPESRGGPGGDGYGF
jgi:hypothetical protein